MNCSALERWRSGRKKTVTSDAEATPKLMAICCIVLAMELAPLACSSRDIGIDKRVHACVLQRREEPVEENFCHDQPHRGALPDGREKQDHAGQ